MKKIVAGILLLILVGSLTGCVFQDLAPGQHSKIGVLEEVGGGKWGEGVRFKFSDGDTFSLTPTPNSELSNKANFYKEFEGHKVKLVYEEDVDYSPLWILSIEKI